MRVGDPGDHVYVHARCLAELDRTVQLVGSDICVRSCQTGRRKAWDAVPELVSALRLGCSLPPKHAAQQMAKTHCRRPDERFVHGCSMGEPAIKIMTIPAAKCLGEAKEQKLSIR